MMPFHKYEIIRKSASIIFTCFFFVVSSKGQCPDKNFLEKRIVYLRDVSNFSSQKQLAELNIYLDKMKNCSYRNDSTHARLAKRIGGLYYQEGDYLNAIKYYRQSINIITANAGSPSVNLSDLPGSYYWLSMMYEALNMVTEKMIALDSCYKVAIRIHYIDAASLRALYKWGLYFFDLGDYHRCIDYMQECESLVNGNINFITSKQQEEYVSGSLLWQVKALLELKEYEKAERMLSDRIEECKRAGLNDNLGTIFSQLAELQLRKGNYDKALLFYNKAFQSDWQAGYNFNCKQDLKDIGCNIYFLHSKDVNTAYSYYTRALKIINTDKSLNSENISETLDLFRLIANVFSQKGQYDSAYLYFQLAFDQIKPGIDERSILYSSQESIAQYKKIHYLASLIIDKGDAYRRQYEAGRQIKTLYEAIRIYKIADQFLDKIKKEQSDLQSKLFWRSDSRRLYENAIEACYLSGNIVDAFYFFEKSRAILLNDQLNEQRWLNEDDIMKQTQLGKKILQLEKELNDSDKSSPRYSKSENELFKSKIELQRLQELIQTNNPLYYQNFVDSNSIAISDINKGILKDHQALIELFTGDSAVYILVITQAGYYLQKIDKSNFDRLSDVYRDMISDPELLNKKFDEFRNVSSQLYNLIFRNVNLPAGRIIISPDGKSFPFEALLTNTKPLAYFVDDHAVSYTYSARYLMNQFHANPATGSYTFMGIAPVRYHNNRIPALSGSDQSLQVIRNYFQNIIMLTGDKASKNNFLNDYYKYKIIQLYTHATDSGFTGEPVIYFSDSALSMSDLFYENKPSTSLIVLSACETANGKLYNGEGVFSFSRQFAALGIPCSISNLWQANNESSYKITELFYKYLSRGLPMDIALQKAKNEFRKISSKEKNLPYYWAAPILVGQTNKIPLQKNFPWKWVGAGVFFILLIATGRWAWQKRVITNQNLSVTKKEFTVFEK